MQDDGLEIENPEEHLANEGDLSSSDEESADMDATMNQSDDANAESDDDSDYLFGLLMNIAEIIDQLDILQNETASILHSDFLNVSELHNARIALSSLESLRNRLYHTGTFIVSNTHNLTADDIVASQVHAGDSTIESETDDYPTFSDLYDKYGIYALRVEKETAALTGNTLLLNRLMNLQKLLDSKISSNYSRYEQ